jgi:uncharacterized protein YndB with AHSA1/START domain
MPDRIEKRIVLRAPIDRVWRAIAHAPSFGSWFGVDFAGVDFVPGQHARGRITHPGYEHLVVDALIERVEPPRLLSLRWHPNAVDSSVDYEREPRTLVVFALQEVESGTLLTLTESGFDDLPDSRRAIAFSSNDEGWEEQTRRIERYVTETP